MLYNRWLLSKGKYDRAFGILRTLAKTNKKLVDETMFSNFKVSEEAKRNVISHQPSNATNVFDLMKTPQLRRNTILLILVW